jgi:DNA-binding NarL/FixJ family response regulator
MIRTLIVAADGSAAEAVRRALRYASTCQVLGWVDARRPYVGAGDDLQPTVITLDDAAGIAVVLARVPELRAAHPDARLILLAENVAPEALAKAAEAGVHAVIAKATTPAAVGLLVREVVAGNVFHFAPASVVSSRSAKAAGLLTSRELEIVRLVAGGLSNNRIAAELWVTEQTVKFHLSNVYRKLGIANRTQAAHYAHVQGLLDFSGAAGPPAKPTVSAAAA